MTFSISLNVDPFVSPLLHYKRKIIEFWDQYWKLK